MYLLWTDLPFGDILKCSMKYMVHESERYHTIRYSNIVIYLQENREYE